ncbi:hypothetical protein F5J12DRAFT_889413 [Pisolithus orientalis]|uniref:uncharacterized protein n=1 Tax=Pisolithus orientalis TaxID=936130 RepID=UPI002224E33A|nr:uncharacterized protein F5J12DRAFT_889413 [Pisolithus orientalis]KAI6028909.1 hypothetical protein F5J12DRAFT_889413 [Pisolithus orientalis]
MELGVDKTQEAGHLAAHPSSLTSFVDEPMVILGTGNTIALWYLPSAITNDLQTHMLATLDPLHHAMSKITGVPGVFPGQAPTGAYGMVILPQGYVSQVASKP